MVPPQAADTAPFEAAKDATPTAPTAPDASLDHTTADTTLKDAAPIVAAQDETTMRASALRAPD